MSTGPSDCVKVMARQFISGTLAMYELRAGKVQLLTAHTGPVIAVAFSSDGKNLATYSVSDNKLHFWQTSTGMFGLGNAQTTCTRSESYRYLFSVTANKRLAPSAKCQKIHSAFHWHRWVRTDIPVCISTSNNLNEIYILYFLAECFEILNICNLSAHANF